MLLRRLQPSRQLFQLTRAMLEELWNERLRSQAGMASSLKAELGKVEQQVEQFLDRIASATVGSAISAYENRIRALEDRRIPRDLGIDSKLRACDLIQLRVRDICHGDRIATRAIVMQQKTHRPLQFEIMEQTREAVAAWIRTAGLHSDDFLFRARESSGIYRRVSTRESFDRGLLS